MAKLSSLNRTSVKNQMKTKNYDIVIIGGGITGAGVALDAASRGMNVALVEKSDFASGTSSRSTKLVHGGLRYLQHFEIKMVANLGKERAIVYENGPHVTTPEWMLLPLYKGSNIGRFKTTIGLNLYDFLAGVKKSERKTILSAEEALQKVPHLKSEELKGAGYYVEYKTDDARLTIEVLKKAVDYGADVMNYAEVTNFLYNNSNQVCGVVVKDRIFEQRFELKGKKIINATGPWVDTLREQDGSKEGKTLFHTKGVHLVFDQSVFPLRQAIYFDSPDNRMIFAIPREGKTYVGTTDTVYKGSLEEPLVTEADCEYILRAIDAIFPNLHLTVGHIESSWSGLRALIAEEGDRKPSEISRQDELFISNSGLISVAGGKLTGYRKMAEEIVDRIVEQFKYEDLILYTESDTKNIPISGGEVGGSKAFLDFKVKKGKEAGRLGLDEKNAQVIIQKYGANADVIFKYYREYKEKITELQIDPVLFAVLRYTIEYEAAYKPSDFFIRRTGALFFHREVVDRYKSSVVEYMSDILNWTEQEKETYLSELNQLLNNTTNFVGNKVR